MIKYKVTLTKEERGQLTSIISKGYHSAQQFRTAYILLNCNEGEYGEKIVNEQVSSVLKTSMRMIDRVKQRFFAPAGLLSRAAVARCSSPATVAQSAFAN